ncbi:E3 ubiquitin-protein ligase ARIH2-like [Sycon ciliatum]|uniref:E3 ubiquitin-protein ligase ARIH2-like n=1 Tax=Sycon ciliatum TaxID=27933 RepID=UPI0031F6BA22
MAESGAYCEEDDFIEDDDDYYNDCDPLYSPGVSQQESEDPETFSYECHSIEQCLLLLRKLAEEIASKQKVPVDVAQLVLHFCNWNMDEVDKRFKADVQTLLLESHATPGSAEDCQCGIPSECSICSASLLECDTQLDKLQTTCNHRFCQDCWAAHFKARIDTVPTMAIECLACDVHIGDTFVCQVLQNVSKYLQLYKRLALTRYVLAHPSLTWCPGVDCQLVIWARESAPKQVTCVCSAQFCFSCRDEYHAPLSCQLMVEWKTQRAAESQSAIYIVANTKPCPKCKVHIEKSGGCNHMVCRHCSFNYCWVCGGDWNSHGTQYYHCSKYKPDTVKEKERSSQQESMKRYFFYFERYQNHHQSILLEERTRESVQQSITRRSEGQDATGTWIDHQYLADAFEILAKSRHTLQYTYPYAYYLGQTAQERTLLEHQQAQLEHEIESLSFLIERAALSDKPAIQLHCLNVNRWRQSLMGNFFQKT